MGKNRQQVTSAAERLSLLLVLDPHQARLVRFQERAMPRDPMKQDTTAAHPHTSHMAAG